MRKTGVDSSNADARQKNGHFLKTLLNRFRKRRIMVAFIVVTTVAATFVFPPVLSSSASTVNQPDEGRKLSEIRRDVRAFVSRSRKAKSDQDLADSVFDMCQLHREIVADQRFAQSKDLQGMRAQLWQRLKTIKNQLAQKIAREEKQRIKDLRARGITDLESQDAEPSPGDFGFLADQISGQISFANQMTGGPSQLFAYAGGSMAGPPDNGPELVRLIEDTINPDHWERNGGPGRIRYYKPLMIIVVTGTTGVHDNISKMLKTLRSISR